MAAKPSMWSKLGKYVSAVVIACFFLPFFGVSCDGMDVVTVSGADMVGGCKPGGLITAAEEEGSVRGGSIEAKVDKVDIEPLAIAALALVLVVFGLSLLETRKAMQGTIVAAVLAIGVLAGLYVKIKGDMGELVEKEQSKAGGSGMGGEIRKDMKIDAGGRFGLWMVGLGLIAVIGMAGSALRAKDAITAVPVPPPQPPAG